MLSHHLTDDGGGLRQGSAMHHRVLAAEHPVVAVGAPNAHFSLVQGRDASPPQTRQRRISAPGETVTIADVWPATTVRND